MLREALAGAEGGRGALVLVTGEAGVGKTRLAEELCSEAERRDAWSLVGRCEETEGSPAFWPWVAALRELADRAPPDRLGEWLRGADASLAGLVPELGLHLDSRDTGASTDDGVRFRLFDAVARTLTRAAGERPLVVLLDDLQWADGASLQLLRFAARQLARARVLLLGTLRNEEPRRADSEAWGELARLARHVALGGLGVDEVAEMLAAASAGPLGPELAARVHAQTGGNPFFVDALAHLWTARSSAEATIPSGVHDAIRHRLRPLGDRVRRILTIAALLGRPFTATLLARASESELDEVASALAEGERHGLLASEDAGGRRRFAHAIVGETLLRELEPSERARLHRRIAEAFEPLVATGGVPVDEVAAHYLEAVSAGAAGDARAYAVRAGERALERLAYEDAAHFFRRALDLASAASAQPRDVVELLLTLADAERRAGETQASRETFGRAATVAQQAGLAAPLARAALGYGAGLGGFWDQSAGAIDAERIGLVERALEAVGPEPSGVRAQLLAHLAASLFWSTSPERRELVRSLGREAVALATAVADPVVALGVLASAHWTSWGPEDCEGRLRTAEEIVRGAEGAKQPEILLRGLMYCAAHRLELGDLRAADRAVDRFTDVATQIGQRRQLWYPQVYRAMRAHLEGRFDEVERAAANGMEIAEVAQPVVARLAFGAPLAMVRREQGRAAEVIPFMREIAESAVGMPVWRCALASILAETGALEEARPEFERLARADFEGLQRNFLWLYGMTHLARAATLLGDEKRSAILYDQLLPYAGSVAVAQHGVVCDGAIDRYLGLLATTLERWDAADSHFVRAREVNDRLGARTFVAATCHDHAGMLRRRDRPEDAPRIQALLTEAAQLARENGQVALLSRIERDDDPPPLTSASAPRGKDDVCVLRREGKVWTLSHAGRVFYLSQTIGLEYLMRLLRHPGREFHAFELLGDGTPSGPRAGDAGEMLDGPARAAYRERLTDLGRELEDAQSCNDVGRAERAQAEIDALTDELARAVGLGRRVRRAGSDAERARVSVTRALRRAVAAVAAHDPALGIDLDRGVRTGLFCSYEVDPRLPVRWKV